MIFPKSFSTPQQSYSSLSAIEYAAIHTGQPCSGTPWLDEMIAKARREQLAATMRCVTAVSKIEELVTTDHETKEAFIQRVREILGHNDL